MKGFIWVILIFMFLQGCTLGFKDTTGNVVLNRVEEFGPEPSIYFCPRDNCKDHLINMISSSEISIHCALYDLDLPDLIDAFSEMNNLIDVKIVMDNHNFINYSFIRKDTSSQLSHNKFCVLDNSIVWTGSFNPTKNDNFYNNNNVIVFESDVLADNYEAEFEELWHGQFGKGALVETPVLFYNNHKIENYFCPEDWCANKVVNVLNGANKSIYFMIFSFTHDQIGNVLIEKFNQGIDVKGVLDKSQNNEYNEFPKLNKSGIPVDWDHNKYKLHHKVFIVDNETVITGSFNPTEGGDTRNDENILIIHDKAVAEQYLEEFEFVFS